MSRLKTEVSTVMGRINLEQTAAGARDAVREQEQGAAKTQQASLSLEWELRELQVAEQKRKDAEEKGRETAEKMEEVAG